MPSIVPYQHRRAQIRNRTYGRAARHTVESRPIGDVSDTGTAAQLNMGTHLKISPTMTSSGCCSWKTTATMPR